MLPLSRGASPRQAQRPGAVWVPLLGLLTLGIVTAVFVIALLVGLIFPAAHAYRIRQAQSACDTQLRRIGQALLLYERDHGCFPPAYLAGPDGKPAHSWRVLVLPYLGYGGLYKRYDFNLPWDSPQNAQLTRLMPDVFACPADPDAAENGETCYMALVGSHAGFAGNRGRRPDEIVNGTHNTILVAELPVAGAIWLDPTDLDADRIRLTVNPGLERCIGSHHLDGANVLMADGTVRFLSDATPSEELEWLISIDSQ